MYAYFGQLVAEWRSSLHYAGRSYAKLYGGSICLKSCRYAGIGGANVSCTNKMNKKKNLYNFETPHIVCRSSEALLLPPNNNKYLIENKNGVLLLNKFNLQLKNVYKWYHTHVWTHRQTNKLNWNLLAATHTQFSLALARFGCNRYNIIFNRLRWHYIEISYTGRRHSASQRHSHTIQIGSFLSMWKNMCLSWYWFDRTIPLHWQSMPTKYSPLCPECRLGWHHTVAVTRT